MVERSQTRQQRLIRDSVNLIEQSDLENLRAWSREDPPPYKRLAVEELPDGFGFDKFRLMVREEYATTLPNADSIISKESSGLLEAGNADTAGLLIPNGAIVTGPQGPAASEEPGRDSDGDVVEEVVNTFLAELADSATHTSYEQSSADSAQDTTATSPRALPVPRSPDNADRPTRSLLKRSQPSYRELSGGGRAAKSKQGQVASINVPEIPPRCCPIEVPSTLLSALDNPCLFYVELAEQFSPLLHALCRRYLQLLAERTSAISAQRDAVAGSPGILSMPQSSVYTPVCRRTSLPDITQHISKQPRLDEPPPLPTAMSINRQ